MVMLLDIKSAIQKTALKDKGLDGWLRFIQCARIGSRETTIAGGDPVIPSSEHCAQTFLNVLKKGLQGLVIV